MIARSATLSLAHSIHLLKTVHPNENWGWFLSKNLHGLTPGFATIPFNDDGSDIAYRIDDLETFAVEFAQGIRSAEEIESTFDKYLDDDLAALLEEDENDPDRFAGCGEYLIRPTLDAEGNIRLESNDILALITVLDEIDQEQLDTGYALTTLAQAFRSLSLGVDLSRADATALSGVATAQASRARYNSRRINALSNAFDPSLA